MLSLMTDRRSPGLRQSCGSPGQHQHHLETYWKCKFSGPTKIRNFEKERHPDIMPCFVLLLSLVCAGTCGGSRAICWNWFSSSTVWGPNDQISVWPQEPLLTESLGHFYSLVLSFLFFFFFFLFLLPFFLFFFFLDRVSMQSWLT